jgi:hypothetical protein
VLDITKARGDAEIMTLFRKHFTSNAAEVLALRSSADKAREHLPLAEVAPSLPHCLMSVHSR